MRKQGECATRLRGTREHERGGAHRLSHEDLHAVAKQLLHAVAKQLDEENEVQAGHARTN